MTTETAEPVLGKSQVVDFGNWCSSLPIAAAGCETRNCLLKMLDRDYLSHLLRMGSLPGCLFC